MDSSKKSKIHQQCFYFDRSAAHFLCFHACLDYIYIFVLIGESDFSFLSLTLTFCCRLDAGEWISQTKNGVRAARALTLVELRTRSDTLRPNVSPQTTSLPAVR